MKSMRRTIFRTSMLALAVVLCVSMISPNAAAATGDESDRGLIAVGAGLAVGLAGIAAGYAQANIGAAAVGVFAEDEKKLGKLILLIVLPETILVFGFVIAYMLYGAI